MKLDNWQQKVMNCKGNMVLRSGRQVGKSTIIGVKAAKYSLENPDKLVMVISKTEKQALLLFAKILFNITQMRKSAIKKSKYRPTKTKIQLTNGTIIHCLCCGDSGYGIMGFTVDLLIADEAAFIPELVWNSIIPALAITRGEIWLLSTPHVKEGYYYNCFSDPTFTSFHTTSEQCPRKDQTFLDHKKATLTRAEYAQMYLGEFVDEFQRLFSESLINERCNLTRSPTFTSNISMDFFLGVDIAGFGDDQTTYEIFTPNSRGFINQIDNIVDPSKTLTTTITKKIKELDLQYQFNKIGVDDGGIGFGVFSELQTDDQTKRKTIALNNASRVYDRDSSGKEIVEKKKKLLKENMYINLLQLMEHGKINLLDDRELKNSLATIQYDTKTGKISGSDSHIAEGIIRGVWVIKNYSLKIYVF